MLAGGVASQIASLVRRVALLLLVVVVAWAFARVGLRAVARLAADRGGIELVVMHWAGEGGPEEDAIVERTLRDFEAANPGIRVRRINPGDSGSFYTKLQTMLAGGQPPDVFYLGNERVASFVSLGLVADLGPFLAADAAAGDALDLEAFFRPTVDAFRYDGRAVGAGPLYGLPKDFTTVGFYINKDLFAKAGIPIPSPDWTWEEYIAAARRLGALDGVVGSEFVTWPFILRAYLRTEGVDVRRGDFDDLAFDDPVVVEALERLRAWRHDEANALTSGKSKLATGAATFTTGTVAMAGPFGRWVVPEYRRITEFEWDFLPLPRGRVHSNIIATVAWSISERSRHKDAAWKLVRWLTSERVQSEQARLGLAIPSLESVAASDAFLDPTALPEHDEHYLLPFRDPDADVRVVDWPADPTFEQLFGTRMNQALLTGDRSLADSIADFERAWTRHRESPLRSAGSDRPLVPWRTIALGATAIGGVGLLGAILLYARGGASRTARREERAGLLLASPWIVGFALFMLVPIAMSLILSLADWKGLSTLDQARAVGFANYAELLLHDERFRRSLWVTLFYVLIAVPGGQIAALGAALLMNAKVRGIALYRAAWYLPSVLAGVGVAVLWRWIFDPEVGLMNALLRPMLSIVGLAPPEWFGKDAALFGPPAFALMSLWMIGGSMLIYLAGLQGIPKDLTEAAEIDGIGPVRRFLSITLPLLSPVILFNTLMALIGSFQVFTQAFVMTGGEPGDLTRFYVLYLYNQAFESYAMGYASAMAWLLLLIVLAITILLLKTSDRFVHYEGLRR